MSMSKNMTWGKKSILGIVPRTLFFGELRSDLRGKMRAWKVATKWAWDYLLILWQFSSHISVFSSQNFPLAMDLLSLSERSDTVELKPSFSCGKRSRRACSTWRPSTLMPSSRTLWRGSSSRPRASTTARGRCSSQTWRRTRWVSEMAGLSKSLIQRVRVPVISRNLGIELLPNTGCSCREAGQRICGGLVDDLLMSPHLLSIQCQHFPHSHKLSSII